VANTHTQLLFFTTEGMVYKLKTWRLPQGGRTAKGKAVVNILPIPPGVSIAAIMPVDRDEEDWDDLQVVFATSAGTVRRNRLSDFTNVKRNGKIAMKFEDDHAETKLINARICSADDDVMLITNAGRAIRFPSTEVRVFNSRSSVGVRGVRLSQGNEVVSMSVIRHFEATSDERVAYLKMRRAAAGVDEAEESTAPDDEADNANATISHERYEEMRAAENLILTITSAMVGGVFLAFSDFIMRSLRATSGTGGIEAMQIINREVFYWAFMVLFIGLAPLSLGLLGYATFSLSGTGAILLRLAAITYLVGVFGVTVARNVPLNTLLDGMDLAAETTQQFWTARYVPDWTFWNTVRTLGSVLTSALCLSGLILLMQA